MEKKKPLRSPSINIKFEQATIDELHALADKYADGSLSAWVRHSTRNYRPKPGEKIAASRLPRARRK